MLLYLRGLAVVSGEQAARPSECRGRFKGLVEPEATLPALASSARLQAITGLDEQGLLRRFTMKWTVENALKDSIESTSIWGILRNLEGTSELRKHYRSGRNSTGRSYVSFGRNSLHSDNDSSGTLSRPLNKYMSSSNRPNRKSRASITHRQSLSDGENHAEEDCGSGSGSGEMSYAESRSIVGGRAGHRLDRSLHHSVPSRHASTGPMLPSSSNSRLPEILASIEKSSRFRRASTQSASLSSRRRPGRY